jgi:tetratricopeptide (TPR) repeat protein
MGIDAWKKLVAVPAGAWAPRRELARVYRKAERWNAFVEVMKDAIDKANWSKPEDKIPVLFEMIEVYRDRLKLDVMVVNAFNQILNIQPTNFEAADALASQYEAMKRWPDLISLLRKKATVVTDPGEKVGLHLRVANLFLEKFSNQAEAIKSFETILELDPNNQEALSFLKQMYEKRRDGSYRANQRGSKIDDEAQGARIDAGVARKLKKPGISIELWRHVLSTTRRTRGPLGLEKLYEREKAWGDLGTCR